MISDVYDFIDSIYNFIKSIVKLLEQLLPILEKYLSDSNLFYDLDLILESLKNIV